MRATKAIIHLDNLKHNIEEIKRFLKPQVKLCIPVKADAYGHGALQVAIAAIKAGAHALAVASIQEGVELRNAGIVCPIMSLSLPTLAELDEILLNNIEPLVMDSEFISALNERAYRLNTIGRVHLKIDTGMNRIGCAPEQATDLALQIADSQYLELAGIATHFAVADSYTQEDIRFTHEQIRSFTNAVHTITAHSIHCSCVHAANSGAILNYPEAHFDMVRPGILVYGYLPSAQSKKQKIQLRPTMSLVTQVVLIKNIKKGNSVSYGCRWTASENTYIGTLPIGYADGLSRLLTGKLKVKIGGEFYPIVGTICMDQCMVDLGPTLRIHRWDEVEIFGCSEKSNTAETLAEQAQTIPYEIISNINKRVPRVYFE